MIDTFVNEPFSINRILFTHPSSAGTEANGAGFAENMASERINKLFLEFNTLAVVYGMPSDQFIADGYQKVSGDLSVNYASDMCIFSLYLIKCTNCVSSYFTSFIINL